MEKAFSANEAEADEMKFNRFRKSNQIQEIRP
jgi:hypothetical protein